jgi:cell division protein FtsI (penicillin-binding protein 3)
MNEHNQNIEEKNEEPVRSLVKFWIILSLITLLLFVVIIRLFIIQVYDAERFKIRAEDQHQAKITLRAERGDIFDRNGKLLASTINSFSIAADPNVLETKYKACRELAHITGKTQGYFLRKINKAKGSFVWLVRGLSPVKAAKINKLDYKGIIKFKEPKRNFLYGKTGSQVIGITNIDNKGIAGIEKAYDTLLTGTSGFMIMQRNALGELHRTANLPLISPVNGNSIVLTIDIELQRIIEFELMKGVEKTKSASGTAIAINPETGEILAMASYPGYNQKTLSGQYSGTMKNKAITDAREPGSTFKLITAAAAVEEGIMSPETIVNGRGGILDFGKYAIRDDHPVGIVTFAEALEHSSNVVFAQVGDSIPKKKFYKYIRDFGFGNTLGIDILGEEEGRIPKPRQFYPFTRRYLSHGYEITATALQIVSAYATIANKGVLMRPYLVKKIINPYNEIIEEKKPQKIRRVVSEKTAEILTEMLCGVVENGTGKNAQISGLKIAGKTGTAQQVVGGKYSKSDYTGSFIGFFPADNPKIALIISFDRPRGVYYGGSTAAPVFRNVVTRWLAIDTDFADLKNKNKCDTIFVPAVKGFFSTDAVKILRDFGLNPILDNLNDGIVISQNPKEGSLVQKGSDIIIKAKKFKTIISDTLDRKISNENYKPDVRGFTVKKAVAILHKAGIYCKIHGNGIVREQQWSKTKDKNTLCILICK